jgi:uncharacterized protein
MFFHIRDLEVRAGNFNVELAPGELEFLDPKLRQTGPLKAKGTVELVIGALDEIRVKGHISVEMEGECDRCLEACRFPLDSDFELYYRPVSHGYGEEIAEKAIDESEADMGFYAGDGIELNDSLQEFAILSLPMQRVCSEACKGICPECGQNRNQKECGCQAAAVDDRWAALKKLSK